MEKSVILFDGLCNYCSGIIRFIARHDKKDYYLFSATQKEAGKQLLKKHSLENIASESVILIDKDKIYIKSTAVLRVYRHLSGLIPVLYALIIVPRFVRDIIYDFIAVRRYKWFGKRISCMVPDEQLKKKFLE